METFRFPSKFLSKYYPNLWKFAKEMCICVCSSIHDCCGTICSWFSEISSRWCFLFQSGEVESAWKKGALDTWWCLVAVFHLKHF